MSQPPKVDFGKFVEWGSKLFVNIFDFCGVQGWVQKDWFWSGQNDLTC